MEKLSNEELEELESNFNGPPEENLFSVYYYSGKALIEHIHALDAELDRFKKIVKSGSEYKNRWKDGK